MIKIAIVGSSKMDYDGCSREIRKVITINQPCMVISGGAKGIDTFASHTAYLMGNSINEFPPKTNNWEGYKERNILIAKTCDKLYNLVIKDKNAYCYHHKRKGHIKSGGCWTENYAKQLGKQVMVIEI